MKRKREGLKKVCCTMIEKAYGYANKFGYAFASRG